MMFKKYCKDSKTDLKIEICLTVHEFYDPGKELYMWLAKLMTISWISILTAVSEYKIFENFYNLL